MWPIGNRFHFEKVALYPEEELGQEEFSHKYVS